MSSSQDHTPNYVDPPSRVAEFLGVQIGMTVLAWIFVSLRIVTRTSIAPSKKENLGLEVDDLLITASLLLGTVESVLISLGVRGGTGLHLWDVPPDADLETNYKFAFAAQVIYMPLVQLIKMSILAFYLRLTPHRNFRLLVFSTMGICAGLCAAVTLIDIFQCKPIQKGWFAYLPGKCIDQVAFYRSTAIINIVLDFTVWAIPIYPLIHLMLPKKQRLALIAIFSVGLFVCVASIIRLTTFYGGTEKNVDADPTWYGVEAQNWSCIEYCTGLICASLPHLKPLFNAIKPGIFGTSSNSKRGNSRSHGYGPGSHNLSRNTYHLNSIGERVQGATPPGIRGRTVVNCTENSSQEYIVSKDISHGITVISDFRVEEENDVTRGNTPEDSKSGASGV